MCTVGGSPLLLLSFDNLAEAEVSKLIFFSISGGHQAHCTIKSDGMG